MKPLIAVLALLSFGSAQAAIVTIDFDEFPGGYNASSITSQGFSFSSEAVFAFGASDTDKDLWYCPHSCTVTMANESSNLFDLYSFDLATSLGGVANVTVTGFYGAGGTVSTIIAVDEIADTYSFDASWTNLTQLVIGHPIGPNTYIGSLDNVKVNVVPIPAAVWLFGSGLGLLGWIKRKQVPQGAPILRVIDRAN